MVREISELLNKVHCGDCLELMREMPDKSVDLVLTDPPYGIGEAAGKNASRSKTIRKQIIWRQKHLTNNYSCERLW
jgi:DNA modification methylase